MTKPFPLARDHWPWPLFRATFLLGSWIAVVSTVNAAEPNPEGVAYFEKHIRPILATKCYDCHSASVQAKGGLRLDTKDGVRLGGQSGSAITPGKPEESLLIDALKYEGLKMPPKGQLSEEAIKHFEEWIRLGAPDPRDTIAAPITGKREIDFDAERKFWAFQPPQKPAIPAVQDGQWPKTDLDRFVLAKLEAASIKPAADANRATWLRRVTFDLTGLPPTPGELLDFELDRAPGAREKVVDRLLASNQFGERWGRHWLDVMRFGESTGKERNFVYLQAWRYRDFVFDSFNQDKPYDQFVKEQIAGDLLPHANDQERDRHHIATGFLALNPKGINDRNRESFLLEIVDEQIESVGRGLMGFSIGCARCHDHKYDAIPTTDYYAVAGILRSSEPRFGMLNRTRYTNEAEFLVPLLSAEYRGGKEFPTQLVAQSKADLKQFQKLQREVRQLRNARTVVAATKTAEGAAAGPAENSGSGTEAKATEKETAVKSDAAPPAPVTPPSVPEASAQPVASTSAESTSAAAAVVADTGASPTAAPVGGSTPPVDQDNPLQAKEKELREFIQKQDKVRDEIAAISSTTMAIGVIDRTDPADIAVRVRGEVDKLGPVVPRGFLTVLKTDSTPVVPAKQSGRLELANWLIGRDNPLVARVFVNRVWSKLLGAGIVTTVDDFGVQGQSPTHPELLDHLAVNFAERGWSTKKLIRGIVLSHVYAIGDQADSKNAEVDGENKLLWRFNRRRLEAEAIRDSVLATSGQLDLQRPSGTPLVELGTRELGPQANYAPVQRASLVRSVYLPQLRGQIPEMLAVFDMADPGLTVGKREATSGPDQALFLLNSPVLLEQSKKFAERLLDANGLDDAARVDLAFRLALGRGPTAAQRDDALQFLSSAEQSTPSGATGPSADGVVPPSPRLVAWSRFCQLLFALPDFRYVF